MCAYYQIKMKAKRVKLRKHSFLGDVKSDDVNLVVYNFANRTECRPSAHGQRRENTDR